MGCISCSKGTSSSVLVRLLRLVPFLHDSHIIAEVKSITGSKSLHILKAQAFAPEIPEDLYHLIKKTVAFWKHLERNRKDKDSKVLFSCAKRKRKIFHYFY
uniref:40S ribosomal protein S13-like n=1 Tax=Nelumbo nucifera TaxID=4432 RepID=A0A823A089_NELNU|nr:TPA_asm: hypothetical protein HUJ06_018942 [Nelumbo nucifera]